MGLSDSGQGFRLLEAAARCHPDACRLQERWADAPQFIVLQIGMGDGLTLLATVQRYAQSTRAPRHLDLVVLDPQPPDRVSLAATFERLGLAEQPAARALCDRWPQRSPGLHRIVFDGCAGLPPGRRVRLTLAVGPMTAMLARLQMPVDAFFVDTAVRGSSSAGRPEIYAQLARLAVPGAVIALATPFAHDREALAASGFQADPIAPGPDAGPDACLDAGPDTAPDAGLVALFRPRWPVHRDPVAGMGSEPRHAAIVGGGLAGCATAAVLADRGWSVTVFDGSASLDGAGGGQPLIADHLHFSSDDNPLARLSRHALWLSRPWRPDSPPIGRVQLAADSAEQLAQADIVERVGLDPELVRAIDADEASERCGLALPRGALWMPGCEALDPARLCAGWLSSHPAIEWQRGTMVATLTRNASEGLWHLADRDGVRLARASVVILAGGGATPALAGLRWPPLQRVRGQSTRLHADPLSRLRTVLGGSAYACPLGDGEVLIGSSFDTGSTLSPDPQADRDNLARVSSMLPADITTAAGLRCGGVGWRYATPDRLPMIGALADEDAIAREYSELARNDRLPLPRQPGLYGHFALGSRGLLWSILGAEVLAALIDGGAPVLESDLLRALEPTRFVRQRLRHRQPL